MLNKQSFVIRLASVFLLVSVVMWNTAFPAAYVFADDPPVEQTQEQSPPTQDTPQQDPPAPQEQTTSQQGEQSQIQNENTGIEGQEGTGGTPHDESVEGGDNGDGADADNGTPAENGEDGEQGGTPDEPGVSDGEPAVIETGDASSGTTGTTVANTSDTTVPNGSGSTDISDTTIEVGNDLDADISGESDAETGDNSANDADGVVIDTGDSDAFGYLISLFNIAITNSSGSILFLRNPVGDALDFTQRIMNVFRNLAGENGECSFIACTLTDAILNIFTNSSAEIHNELLVRSGTGENTGESEDGSVEISTGNASAFGSIVNFGNLQIVDSRYLVILMTNVGDLDGDIILPEPDFFKELSSGAAFARGTDATINNTADITNHGTTTAETGDNSAQGETYAAVDSGDARATGADMNFINQIGAPLCFIVNVGGDWDGDVYQLPEGFDREVTPFGEIICGAGGGDRSHGSTFNGTTTNYAKILNEAIVEATTGGNSAIGVEALIETGNADAFLQILNVVNQTIIGQDWIFSLFTVSGDWHGDMIFGVLPEDDDPAHEVASQLLAGASIASGGAPGGYFSNPKIEMTKTVSVSQATVPTSVDYTITLKNVGEGIAYRSKLTDILVDPTGAVVYERSWRLDSIAQGEEVTLSYSVEYNENIPYGIYANVAHVTGFRNSSLYVHPEFMAPGTAKATVEVFGDVREVALEDAGSCTPLLTTYMRLGKTNDANDARDLQQFLNEHEGENLEVNGIYSIEVEAAVKRFQAKYTPDVLTPWGIQFPTGNVYYTTQRKVNELACTSSVAFPLSDSQITEIEAFKARFLGGGIYDLETEDVGDSGKKETAPGLALPPLPPLGVGTVPQNTTSVEVDGAQSRAEEPFRNIVAWFSLVVPFVEAFEL